MDVYRQDKDRWMDRFKDNRAQLLALKAEIAKMVRSQYTVHTTS